MTFYILTVSVMDFSIMTTSIMTLSIMLLTMTQIIVAQISMALSITVKEYGYLSEGVNNTECRSADCRGARRFSYYQRFDCSVNVVAP